MEAFFSWGSTVLVLLLSVIYPLRIIKTKYKLAEKHPVSRWNDFLRKAHKKLGILSIVFVWMHCSVSGRSTGVDSGIGVFLLILLVLLALSYPLGRLIGSKWMAIHRVLTVILLLGTIFHSFFEFI